MSTAFRIAAVLSVTTFGWPAISAAHSPYGKALKDHYQLRSVTCYACHKKGKDEETGKPLGKEHLNEFGEALDKLLRDKAITEKLEAAKTAGAAERKVANEYAAEAFLEAFGKIESEPGQGDMSWSELIKSGDLEGIRLKK